MKLLVSTASPFARKCSILIREKGILDKFDEEIAMPIDNPPELLKANPIAQVPALILDDGSAIFNSPLICAYIDNKFTGPKLVPEGFDAGFKVRRLEALGDAIMEMAVKIAFEGRRDEDKKSELWLTRWNAGIKRGLEEAETAIDGQDFSLGLISIACALGYLDFRHPNIDWKSQYKELAEFQKTMEARPSFIDTAPK